MTDFQAIADRVEIDALSGEFTDAALQRDWDRFAALFTPDGAWRMPNAGIEFESREAIRDGIGRLQGFWNYFVQNTHSGHLKIDGDTAVGRVYIEEFGEFSDGRSHLNYAIYHDRYRRIPDGWRFTERSYEIRYVDTTPLTGAPPTGFTEPAAPPASFASR